MNEEDDIEDKEVALGVCKLLPPQARRILVEAAATRRMDLIDAAIDYAKACHPLQFKYGEN